MTDDVTLYLGDCLNVLRDLPDGSVDAVVTDPPYFLPASHYCTRQTFARSLSDLSMLEYFYRDVFAEMARVTKPTGTWYVFCDGQSYPVFFVQSYRYVRQVRPLIWDKIIAFNGYGWRHQHEIILYAELPESKAPATGDGDILRCRAVRAADREHPAEKPIEILDALIAKSTVDGGTVMDPFMGSAATGVACVQTGRRFIGVEIDEGYYAIAEKRIAEARAQLPLPLAEGEGSCR